MALATWLTVAILGPGALGIFIWFLVDLRQLFPPKKAPSEIIG